MLLELGRTVETPFEREKAGRRKLLARSVAQNPQRPAARSDERSEYRVHYHSALPGRFVGTLLTLKTRRHFAQVFYFAKSLLLSYSVGYLL